MFCSTYGWPYPGDRDGDSIMYTQVTAHPESGISKYGGDGVSRGRRMAWWIGLAPPHEALFVADGRPWLAAPHKSEPSVPSPRIAVAVSLLLLLAKSPRCNYLPVSTAGPPISRKTVHIIRCGSAHTRTYFADNLEVTKQMLNNPLE